MKKKKREMVEKGKYIMYIYAILFSMEVKVNNIMSVYGFFCIN